MTLAEKIVLSALIVLGGFVGSMARIGIVVFMIVFTCGCAVGVMVGWHRGVETTVDYFKKRDRRRRGDDN